MIFKTKNKKASIDSAFVWIIAFLVIVFILIITNVFVFSLFVVKGGSKTNVVFEENNNNLILNKKFLSFLNTKISVNNKEEKIIDSIRNSLDPYFEIKNENGKNLVDKYSLNAITEDYVLKDKMMIDGFDENDWDNFVKANLEFQESEKVKKIIEELNKLCNVDRWDRYFLETPLGIITKDGLKAKQIFNEEDSFYYTEPIIHKTNYRGENIEIKFRMYRECI